jgi:menaquinone-9 beta-reductase
MTDVLIVGAGPAGATAALVLARAGVRVTLLDRARFPRPKLCGDTLNPGTLALLRRLGVEAAATRGGRPLAGMRLTGPRGVRVEARYPDAQFGACLSRFVFDHQLLETAVSAGAELEQGISAKAPILEGPAGKQAVRGVVTRSAGGTREVRAEVVIAADGRSSILASSLRLSRAPVTPRRWAIGAYYEGVSGLSDLGEMHIRPTHYIGVAPLPGDLANAILVAPRGELRQGRPALLSRLARALAADPELAPRFSRARAIGPPAVLGPLALDVAHAGTRGLLLAGDAAGFIDPMTGDGMRLAMAGAELTANAALEALEHGWDGVEDRLDEARRQAFSRKWRFNRAMRCLTGSRAAVGAMAACMPLLSPVLARAIAYAGDVAEL